MAPKKRRLKEIPNYGILADANSSGAGTSRWQLKLYQPAGGVQHLGPPPGPRAAPAVPTHSRWPLRARKFSCADGVVAEIRIAVPLVAVDLGNGRTNGEAYRAINPRRVLPTLVLEDGTAVGEVLAIWRDLAEAQGAERYWSSNYIQRSAHIVTGRIAIEQRLGPVQWEVQRSAAPFPHRDQRGFFGGYPNTGGVGRSPAYRKA